MSECRAMAFGGDAGLDGETLATVLGNRAGVVEWANETFARLTGIPLADTVNKPVTRFLERAGLDLEVVDFVAQHFFEGRPCRLEFPFERPDGRRIEVLLEVEGLRDAMGEIDRFRATARERHEPAADALVSPPTAVEAGRPARPESAYDEPPAVELGQAIHRALAAAQPALDPAHASRSETWLLDLALSPEPLAIRARNAALEALLAALLRAAQTSLALADHAWGTITLTTGRTTPHRRFLSKVHAIPASAPAHADASRIHLEVHDTGARIEATALARLRRLAAADSDVVSVSVSNSISASASASASASQARSVTVPERVGSRVAEAFAASEAREEALVDAIQRARRLGASIHFDSTPGCGNQVLVLFPT